ncbi:MAG: Hsp20 family protein [Candidatus Bathyarchaeota archaeon]|jgi:HSP20 family molecular chaperone IbpA|nr:Hsp20 family protein [Candidatus Bathyarchaeota archaeon]
MQERRRRRTILDLIREYIEDIEALSEEFMEPSFVERPSWNARTCCLEPLCSVFVTPDEVIVTADLPNTNPDTIEISPTDADTIEIRAEMKRKIRFDELGITHRKGEFQFFHCQTNIPVPVNMNIIKTEFKRGILEVHIPRKKGYKIKVE